MTITDKCWRYNMKVAIIAANTDIYKGTKANESGEAVKLVAEEAGLEVVFMRALPLDREVLSAIMKRLADGKAADLILTTGGAGCNPDDCTPEATMDIVERPVPGIPEAIRAYSMTITKRAMLSRATAGIRKKTLIINLPGSPKAVKESLEYIIGALGHGIEIMTGEAGNCARQ